MHRASRRHPDASSRRAALAQPWHSPGTAPAPLAATSPASPGLCPSARVSGGHGLGTGGDGRGGNGRRFDRAEHALPAAVCLAIRLGRTANTWSGGWPRGGWRGSPQGWGWRVHPRPCVPTSARDPSAPGKEHLPWGSAPKVRAPAHGAAVPPHGRDDATLGSPCAARHRPPPDRYPAPGHPP